MIRLLVLDVDGTMTDRERRISPEVVKAVPRVQDSGVTVSLVSGNVIPVMYALKTYLGINGPVLGENGGIMLDGNVITKFFSPDVPREFYSMMSHEISVSEILTNRWRETSVAFEGERESIASFMGNVQEHWKSRIQVVDSRYAWHIMNREQGKDFAVRKLSEMYNVGHDEILVCGDSDNDLAMYEAPVRKATMANGTGRIKEQCEYVSPYSHGEGLVDIFTHFGLLQGP